MTLSMPRRVSAFSNGAMLQSTEKSKSRGSKIYMQWIATFAAFLLMLQVGVQIGWSSPNIPRLTGENSPIPVTPEEASWLISLTGVGGFASVIVGALSIGFLGSKRSIIFTFVIFSISYICLICASSVEMLYVARGLGGVAAVLSYSSFPMYVGEISVPEIRGTLVSFSSSGNLIGSVLTTIAETYIEMKITSSIYLAICIASLVLLFWLKDTPYFFVKKNNYRSAKTSITFYRGFDEEDKYFQEVKKFIDAQSNYTLRDKLKDFRLPVIRKSMILIVILFGLPHLSGQISIMGYMETILRSANITLINPQEFVIYANVISIISTLLTAKLMDILGRKILLLISSVGVMISMLALGTHFYLIKVNNESANLQWLSLFALILYLVAQSIGLATVPSTVLSELFPEHLKGIAAAGATLSASLFGFLSTKLYQPITDSIGQMYVFWMHAAFASLGILCALFLMPETKGKSLQEIQEALAK